MNGKPLGILPLRIIPKGYGVGVYQLLQVYSFSLKMNIAEQGEARLLIMDEYIINHKTQALLHYKNSRMGGFTIAKEVSKTFLVKQSPIQIIMQTQLFYNFESDKPKKVKKVHDMLVLTIAPYVSIGLCPTTDHVWIIESHIKRLEKMMDGRMIIYFTNEKVITLYPKRKEWRDSFCLTDDEKKDRYESKDTSHGQHFLKEETTIRYTIRFKGRRKR